VVEQVEDGALERTGGELALSWSRRSRIAQLAIEGGALLQQIELASSSFDQRALFAEIEPRVRWSFGNLKLGARALGRYEDGETEGTGWARSTFVAEGEIGWTANAIALAWERVTSWSEQPAGGQPAPPGEPPADPARSPQ